MTCLRRIAATTFSSIARSTTITNPASSLRAATGCAARPPGAAHIGRSFALFKSELPRLAAALNIADNEIDPFHDYRDYIQLLESFLLAS